MEAQNAIHDLKDKGEGFIQFGNTKLLNLAVIFGANSSGKSNLLQAMATMRHIVTHSVKLNDSDELPYYPFLFSSEGRRPTVFEVKFSIDKDVFIYTIEYNKDTIIREVLSAKFPRCSEKQLFKRIGNTHITIDHKYFSEAQEIQQSFDNDDSRIRLNSNRLLLSLAGQLGGEISNKIINWFGSCLQVISGISEEQYSDFTKKTIHKNPDMKAHILEFLESMDLGFDGIKTKAVSLDDVAFPAGMPKELIEQFKKMRGGELIEVSSVHNLYDNEGNLLSQIDCDFEDTESAGTKKVFNLAGPIMDSLLNGGILCVDELDSKLHPLLTRRILEVFNNSKKNTNGAQLIATNHDTSVMGKDYLRRDQICFVEKNKKEESFIERLSDKKIKVGDSSHTPRPDSNYEKNYLGGVYGAVPKGRE